MTGTPLAQAHSPLEFREEQWLPRIPVGCLRGLLERLENVVLL